MTPAEVLLKKIANEGDVAVRRNGPGHKNPGWPYLALDYSVVNLTLPEVEMLKDLGVEEGDRL